MKRILITLTLFAVTVVFAKDKNSVTSASSTQSAVQQSDTYDFTPLVAAAVSGDTEGVRDLIEKGADVNGCDTRGDFPLYAAVVGDHPEVVELLIKKGANVNQAKAANVQPVMERNTTALHAASMIGNQSVVELLINAGADVNAFANTNEEEARLSKSLTDNPVGFYSETIAELRRQQREIGVTPLTQASKFGHANIVKLLLEHGANVNFQKPGDNTALIEAATAGRRDVIELLVSQKADLNRKGLDGETALFNALINEQYDSAKFLLAAGADDQLTNDSLDMSVQYFAWGIYQTLVADKLTAESRSVEAREKYTEALASLTAARDELNRKADILNNRADEADKDAAKADKQAHSAERLASWIPILDIVGGAAGSALTDYSQRSGQRQMGQIIALKNSKTPNEYFANYERLEGASRPISSPLAPDNSHIAHGRSGGIDTTQFMRISAQIMRSSAQTARSSAQIMRDAAQPLLRKAATCDYLIGRVSKILSDGTGK